MPAEVIIGSVGVKITPDLTDFRREAERDLDRVERELKDVEVGIDLDDKGVKAKAKALSEELSSEIGDIEVGVDVNVKQAAALKAIQAIQKQMAATRQALRINVETPSVTQIVKDTRVKLANASRELQADRAMEIAKFKFDIGLDRNKTKLELDAHMKALQATLRPLEVELSTNISAARRAKLESQIARIKQDMSDIDAIIQPHVSRPALARVMATFAMLKKPLQKEVVINFRKNAGEALSKALSRITGIRMLWELHKEKFAAMADFDKLAPKIATMATSMALLSSWLASAASSALSVVHGLAQIAMIGPAIPGIVAGIGLAFWAVKTAMKDFDAQIPGFKDSVQKLEASMSGEFWDKARKPIQSMIDKLFPEFTKSMARVSSAAGTYFGSLASEIEHAFGGGRINRSLTSVADAFTNLGKSSGALAQLTATLAEFGMKQLPGIADSLSDIIQKTNYWIQGANDSGALQQFYDRAASQLGHLVNIAKNVGVAIYNLGGIAERSGAATLSSLDKMTAAMAAMTSNSEFQSGLGTVLTSVHLFFAQLGAAFSQNIGDLAKSLTVTIPAVLGSLGPALSNLLGSIMGGLSGEGFQNGLVKGFEGIASAADSLAPIMGVLADKIGLVFALAGGVVKELAPLFALFVEEAARMIETIAPAFQSFISVIGPAVQQVFGSLQPLFAGVANAVKVLLDALGPALSGLLQNITPVLAQLSSALGDGLAKAAQALAPVLPPIAQMLGAIVGLLGPLVSALLPVVVSIIQTLAPIIATVAGLLTTLVNALKPVLEAVMPLLVGVLDFAVKVIGDTIAGLINGITNIVEGVINVVQGIWNFFDDLFHARWGELWGDVLQVFTGIWQILLGAFQVYIYGSFLKILSGGLTLLRSLWTSGWGAIKTFFTTIWDALVAAFRSGTSSMTSLFSNALNAVRNAFQTAWSWVKSATSSFIEGLKTVVSDGIGKVVEFFRGLPGKARDAILAGRDLMVSAGRDFIAGLVGGLEAGRDAVIQKVKDIAGGALDAFKGFFGIRSPSRVMYKQGSFLVDGLVNSISDRTKDAVSSVEDMAKKMAAVDMTLAPVDKSFMDGIQAGSLSGQIGSSIAGGDQYGVGTQINVTANGSSMDANELAGEIMFAYRRASSGGRYGRRV